MNAPAGETTAADDLYAEPRRAAISGRSTQIARELAYIGVFLLITFALTWPLARSMRTASSDLGDPLLNAWIVNWDLYSATHGFPHLYQAPIFHPAKFPLAYSENLFGIAIVGLPFYLAGAEPLLLYNILFVLGLALSCYAASIVARLVTRSMWAGIVSGILYGFTLHRLDHFPHLQIVWGAGLPLVLAALLWFERNVSWRSSSVLGLALLFNGLTNVHFLLFGTTAAALTILVKAVLARRIARDYWLKVAGAFAIALIPLFFVLLPYKIVADLYNMRREWNEIMRGSATLWDWLAVTGKSATYWPRMNVFPAAGEHALFPGLMVILLSLAAMFCPRDEHAAGQRAVARNYAPARGARRALLLLDTSIVLLTILAFWTAVATEFRFSLFDVRIVSVAYSDLPFMLLLLVVLIRCAVERPRLRRVTPEAATAIGWIALGVVGSLGLHAFFHEFLFFHVPAFRAIRAPARWASIAYAGLAITAAMGVANVVRGSRIRRVLLGLVLTALAFHDVRPDNRWEHTVDEVDRVYDWLRDTPAAEPFVELPINGSTPYLYMLGAAHHHRITLNGTSGFDPPPFVRIRDLWSRPKITSEFTNALRESGCRFVVVHEDWLAAQGPSVRAWLSAELQSGRLLFIRRFDHRTAGDWLFALRDNVRDASRYVPTPQNDRVGNSPVENLRRFLHDEPTYLDRTFGMLDTPLYDSEVERELTVSGWALSPWGIDHVDAVLQCGAVRVRAELGARPDVEECFPWYPGTEFAGFHLVIPKRPSGVPNRTNLQIEIFDRAGRMTRLPDVFVEWKWNER